MQIAHIALWVKDLEEMKSFYVRHFHGQASSRYENTNSGFTSYFITFKKGARLELMHQPNRVEPAVIHSLGFHHLAFQLVGRDEVVTKTNTFRSLGFHIISEPRVTGDGYFESVIADPEGNHLELVSD